MMLCRLMPPLLPELRPVSSICLSDLACLILPSVSRCGDLMPFMSSFLLNRFGLRAAHGKLVL
jgi:hypothetical protein